MRLLKILLVHYSKGGPRALLGAATRAWRRFGRRQTVALDAAACWNDPLGRPPVVIVAGLALESHLGFHPAAMLFAAAKHSGRAVHYIDVSQRSSMERLKEISGAARGEGQLFVFAKGRLARELVTAVAGTGLSPRLDESNPAVESQAITRPPIYCTTAVVDAYTLPSPRQDRGQRTRVLVPLFGPITPERVRSVQELRMKLGNARLIVSGPELQGEIGSGIEVHRVEHFSDLIHAIWNADALVPDLASDELGVVQTLTGAAVMLKRWVVMAADASWNDSPLTVAHTAELAVAVNRGLTPVQAAEVDGYIASHDAFASLDAAQSRFAGSVSVVVLVHNNVSIIGRFLDTLRMHCSAYLADVIVVDNASADGSAEYVEEHFPWVTLLRNVKNGCSSGRNLGVGAATGRYIAFFDSDQWFVSGNGFEEALLLLERHPDLGAVGWNAGWFDTTRSDLGGMISDYAPRRGMNSEALAKGYRVDIGFLGTSGFFLRREHWDALEGFDETYDPTCFEDTDLSFQIKATGLKLAFRDLTGIRHQAHQTTQASAASERYLALFKRNGDYFRRKWSAHQAFFVDYDWSKE